MQNTGYGGGELIGAAGTGIFTQSGGTNQTTAIGLGGQASLYNGNGSVFSTPGTYNLQHGLLQTGQISGAAGYANFNFTGGTLQIANPPSQSTTIGVDITAASGYLDLNGNKISIQNLATASGFDLNIKTPGRTS